MLTIDFILFGQELLPSGLYFCREISLSMSPKRVLGWVILVLFIIAYIGLFVFGGIDGLRNGFTFHRFFLRFLTIGAVIKAFDGVKKQWR